MRSQAELTCKDAACIRGRQGCVEREESPTVTGVTCSSVVRERREKRERRQIDALGRFIVAMENMSVVIWRREWRKMLFFYCLYEMI